VIIERLQHQNCVWVYCKEFLVNTLKLMKGSVIIHMKNQQQALAAAAAATRRAK
jgi:hypothetical protein